MDSSGSGGTQFGSTLTGGIQDISALLPLLGTEQCEEHIGSALKNGYHYAAATPLSIFGNLGLALAGIKTLIGSMEIWYFKKTSTDSKTQKRFWTKTTIAGAHTLFDMGFQAKGETLPLIMLDPNNKMCYLAETRLESLLTELHVDDFENLDVSINCWKWNVKLVAWTATMCILSMTPYIHLDLRDGSTLPPKTRWLFPAIRASGGFFAATMIQFIIQTRLMIILKKKLSLLKLLRSPIVSNPCKEILQSRMLDDLNQILEAWVAESRLGVENGVSHDELDKFKDELAANRRTRFSRIGFHLVKFLLAVGIVGTIVGYVGCFSVVQSTGGSVTGPAIWLALETVFAVLRFIIWGLNPIGDDPPPIKFTLKLTEQLPLSSCNKFAEDMEEEKILPLVRANDFLKSLTSSLGLLHRFDNPNLTLFYTHTRSNSLSHPRRLYITIFDYREKTTRICTGSKSGGQWNFKNFFGSIPIIDLKHDILEVNIEGEITPGLANDPIVGNEELMTELEAHYRAILSQEERRVANLHMYKEDKIFNLWTLKFRDTDSSNLTAVVQPVAQAVARAAARAVAQALAQTAMQAAAPVVAQAAAHATAQALAQAATHAAAHTTAHAAAQTHAHALAQAAVTADIIYLGNGHLQYKNRSFRKRRSNWILDYMVQVRRIEQFEGAVKFRVYEWMSMEIRWLLEVEDWETQLGNAHISTMINMIKGVKPVTSPVVLEVQRRMKQEWARSAWKRLKRDRDAAIARAKAYSGNEFDDEVNEGVVALLKDAREESSTAESVIREMWQPIIDHYSSSEKAFDDQGPIRFRGYSSSADLKEFEKNTMDKMDISYLGILRYGRTLEQAMIERIGGRLEGERQAIKARIERGLEGCEEFRAGENIAFLSLTPSKWIDISAESNISINSNLNGSDHEDFAYFASVKNALERNSHISLIQFRGFQTDAELAKALSITHGMPSLTTIRIVYSGYELGETLTALDEATRRNLKISSTTRLKEGQNVEEIGDLKSRLKIPVTRTSFTFTGGFTISPNPLYSHVNPLLIDADGVVISVRFFGPRRLGKRRYEGMKSTQSLERELTLKLCHRSYIDPVAVTLSMEGKVNECPLNNSAGKPCNTQITILSRDLRDTSSPEPNGGYFVSGKCNLLSIKVPKEVREILSIELIDDDGTPYLEELPNNVTTNAQEAGLTQQPNLVAVIPHVAAAE